MSGKIIIRHEFVEKVLKAVDTVCDAVKVTLGPSGRLVIIDSEDLPGGVRCTKDGVTVANSISLIDSSENAIAKLICETSKTLNRKQGDGTTSCLVMLQSIIKHSIHDVKDNENTNINEYFKGMDYAVKEIVKYIEANTVEIKDNYEKIKQVAMIASNGDEEHSEFIARAYQKIGIHGSVSCHEAHGNESTLEIVDGMNIDRGYLSQYFVNTRDKTVCELDNPFVLLYDKKISSSRSIVKALDECVRQSRALLIIAEDVEGEALSTLVINKLRGVIKVCAIKAPGFGDRRNDILEDIAILTGGKVISADKGEVIDNIEDWSHFFGSAQSIIIDKDETVIVDGHGNKEDIKGRVEIINNLIKSSSSDYETEKLVERMAKLGNGIAKINIAATTETELKERKDSIEDASHAAESSVKGGVVIGSGVCTMRAADAIIINDQWNHDFKAGVKTIKKASSSVISQILKNACLSDQVVIDNVRKNNDKNYGYNVRTGEYCNLYENGVIGPAKVETLVITASLSIAKKILQAMVIITDKPSETPEQPAMNPQMMGY